MTENKENDTKKNEEVKNKLTFEDNAIRKIVGITAQQIDGIVTLNGSPAAKSPAWWSEALTRRKASVPTSTGSSSLPRKS